MLKPWRAFVYSQVGELKKNKNAEGVKSINQSIDMFEESNEKQLHQEEVLRSDRAGNGGPSVSEKGGGSVIEVHHAHVVHVLFSVLTLVLITDMGCDLYSTITRLIMLIKSVTRVCCVFYTPCRPCGQVGNLAVHHPHC